MIRDAKASALSALRDFVTGRVGERDMNDAHSVAKVRFDASDHQLLFLCVVHGKVVPSRDRYDCPKCPADGLPVPIDAFRARLVSVVDRATGMLVLNPS